MPALAPDTPLAASVFDTFPNVRALHVNASAGTVAAAFLPVTS